MPAFLVWDHEKEKPSASKEYNRYAISRLEQKDVLEGTAGENAVHPDDVDKYVRFMTRKRDSITELRLLTTQKKRIETEKR